MALTHKRGLVLGTFMPLHDAHLFVFDVAEQLVDELTVLLCATPNDPIDVTTRKAWLETTLPDHIKLKIFVGDLPWVSRRDDLVDAWADMVRTHHEEKIDLLIGSDWPIAKLAKRLEVRPFLADPHRIVFPTETAEILASPHTHWHLLAPAARAYFQKRICLLGPESTGKSRMADRLADAYNTRVIPEYGRTYDEVFKQKGDWVIEELEELAIGHLAIQRAASKRAGGVVFEDTDPIQTVAWAEYLLKTPSEHMLDRIGNWEPADHYLLLSPDVAWVDDGVRYDPKQEVRQWFYDRMGDMLSARGLPVTLITGADWENRYEQGAKAVEAFLKG